MRRPRGLRPQLTLLYAVPFFLSSALLLVVPVLQGRRTVAAQSGGILPPPSDPADDLFRRLLIASALALVFMIGVSLILGWLVAGRFLRPLHTIIATAQNISASNLDRRVGSTGSNDEFNDLAATLDEVFERLERAFEAQRQFVANASHELRTPLTAERALLQVALADPRGTESTLRAACQEVLTLGAAQERLIDALLTLAAGDQLNEILEPVDLAELADRAVRKHTGGTIEIKARLTPAPAVGDPRLLASLVANLVDNAVRHNRTGGEVEISTGILGDRPALLVRNTGPVVPAAEVERLFEPFQRLRGQRTSWDGGHGLGLAIVRSIAHRHRAALRARPVDGGGMEFLVRLPPLLDEQGRQKPPATAPEPWPGPPAGAVEGLNPE